MHLFIRVERIGTCPHEQKRTQNQMHLRMYVLKGSHYIYLVQRGLPFRQSSAETQDLFHKIDYTCAENRLRMFGSLRYRITGVEGQVSRGLGKIAFGVNQGQEMEAFGSR